MKCTIAILLVFISTTTFAVENSSDDATEPTTLFDVSETESYDEIEENNGEPHSIQKRQASQSGPYIVELLVVVDKEFGDLFQQDYWKIKDYLTIYFWDVNMRFKTLWGVDVTFRVNSLLTMRKPEEQPFIEKARAADGRTNNDRILHLFKFWVYEQQSWLSRQDVAILLTATKREWNGGLSFIGGACTIWEKADYGAVVINDDGNFQSAPAASHELAHSLNAKHDNDPSVNFPGPYNFIMATDYYNQTAFSKVSNEYISNFVKSDSGACVRRIDGYETTPIDRSFSSPKAPNMQDLCKLLVKDPNAWIDTADTFNCQVTKCKRRDANNNVIPTEFVNVIQNLQCGNGGRCFRGRCRPESKLLKHVASGNCLLPDGRFSYSVGSRMVPCPSSKDKTPLDTIEVIDFNGKRLATPFLYNDNNESSDKCIYTGTGPNDIIWTDRCGDNSNPWHAWDFKPVNGDANKFQLVHRVTGRCVRPGANPSDYVFTGPCTTDANLVWTWTDGV